MALKDKTEQDINVGSLIAYAITQGDSAGLRIGKVLAINGTKMTVIGIDDYWRGPKLLSRKGTLTYPSRIIVLDPKCVPEAFRKLLDPITNETKISGKNG